MERANAWELLREYNKDHFHLQHALTVEAVMRWFANDLGYGEEADYISWYIIVRLLFPPIIVFTECVPIMCASRRFASGIPSSPP